MHKMLASGMVDFTEYTDAQYAAMPIPVRNQILDTQAAYEAELDADAAEEQARLSRALAGRWYDALEAKDTSLWGQEEPHWL